MYRIIPVIQNPGKVVAVIDIYKLCRTCGVCADAVNEPFLGLFENIQAVKTVNPTILELLSTLQLGIEMGDGLPQKICAECSRMFTTIENFYMQCRQMKEIYLLLQQSCRKVKTDPIETIDIVAKVNLLDDQTKEEPRDDPLEEVTNIEIAPKEIEQLFKNIREGISNAQEIEIQNYEMSSDSDCNIENQDRYFEYSLKRRKDPEENVSNVYNKTKELDENEEIDLNISNEIEFGHCEIASDPDNEEKGDDWIMDYKMRRRNVPKKKRIRRKTCKDEKPRLLKTPHQVCKFCKKSFGKVILHQRTCSERNVEFCKYCFIEIPTVEELMIHIDEKHPLRLPACHVCFCAFRNHTDRQEHVMKNHHEGKYRCQICDYDYRWKGALQRHNMQVHGEIIDRPCPICEKICKTQIKYDYHIKTHDPEQRRFRCRFCEKTFVQPNHLAQHERGKHTGERSYLCDMCGETFVERPMLVQHESLKHGVCIKTKSLKPSTDRKTKSKHSCKVKGEYACEECDKKFAWKGGLSLHMSMHANPSGFKCTYEGCEKIYKSRTNLYNHISRDHKRKGIITKPFACSLCPNLFTHLNGLETHIRHHHRDKRDFKCDICGDTFKRREHVRSHMRRKHIKEKKFACSYCPKKFIANYELRAHIRIHTGEKPYKCPYCPQAFKFVGTLRVHKRSHTGDTPYICMICQKNFINSTTLSEHYFRHSSAQLRDLELKGSLIMDTTIIGKEQRGKTVQEISIKSKAENCGISESLGDLSYATLDIDEKMFEEL